MKVYVKTYLGRNSQDKLKPNEFNEIELKNNISVEKLLDNLEIDKNSINIIKVNNKIVSLDYNLSSKDKIILFPPIIGG